MGEQKKKERMIKGEGKEWRQLTKNLMSYI